MAPKLPLMNAALMLDYSLKLWSKLELDESFYNLIIYEVFTDLSVVIKRGLQRYRRP